MTATAESSPAGRYELSHLRSLEAEAIHIIREVAAEFERDLPFSVWTDALDAYVASVNAKGGVKAGDGKNVDAAATTIQRRASRSSG